MDDFTTKSLYEENEIDVTDIYLTAALVAMGYHIESIKEIGHKKSAFIFSKTPGLLEDISKHNRKEVLLTPQSLFNGFKEVKTRLYNQY